MTDLLLREIDEEVRKDRLTDLWKRFGHKLVALAVVLVLGAMAYTGWVGSKIHQQQDETGRLLSVLQDTSLLQGEMEQEAATSEDKATLQKNLADFADGALAGQATIARLFAAGITKSPEQREAALAGLNKIAADDRVDTLYRSLATLFTIQLELDTGDIPSLRAKLEPLKADSSPWHASARELSALLSIRAGDKEAAVTELTALHDSEDIPNDMKERTAKVLSVLAE